MLGNSLKYANYFNFETGKVLLSRALQRNSHFLHWFTHIHTYNHIKINEINKITIKSFKIELTIKKIKLNERAVHWQHFHLISNSNRKYENKHFRRAIRVREREKIKAENINEIDRSSIKYTNNWLSIVNRKTYVFNVHWMTWRDNITQITSNVGSFYSDE